MGTLQHLLNSSVFAKLKTQRATCQFSKSLGIKITKKPSDKGDLQFEEEMHWLDENIYRIKLIFFCFGGYCFKYSIIHVLKAANFIERCKHTIQVALTPVSNSSPCSQPCVAHGRRPHLAVTTRPSHSGNARCTTTRGYCFKCNIIAT